MSVQAPIEGFSCEDCGSPGISIVGPLDDLAPVRCTGCGRDLGPWDLFLDDLNRRLAACGVAHARQDPGAKQEVYETADAGLRP